MDKKKTIFILILLIFIALSLFYKTVLLGLIPFPGDLLISEYNPWRTYSYLGYNPGSHPSKTQYFDVIRQIYPWKTLSVDILKNGELPFWNPYNFSGAPLLANNQSAVFYPPNIFYLIFSPVVAWTILIILQPLLAGYFTYLYAKKIGISMLGALLSSIAFSYSLFMTVFFEYNTIGHVILFLPLSLYLIEKIRERPTVLKLIIFITSVTFPFLAGHLQAAGFSLAFLIIYILFRVKKRILALLLIAFISLGLGVAAIQLLPTLELISISARAPQDYQFLISKLLLKPAQLILIFSPDFFGNPATRNYLIPDTYPTNAVYIGLAPLIFALFAVGRRFFVCAAIVLLAFLVRTPFTEVFYKLQIPLVSTGSPNNAIFLLSFCLSILCGFGLDNWIKKPKISHRLIILSIVSLFSAIWLVVLVAHPQIVSTRNFFYSTIIFVAFIVLFFLGNLFIVRKKFLAILVIGLLLLTVFDLFYFFQKFNPFVPREFVFPKAGVFDFLSKNAGIYRFWGYGTASIDANFATQYRLFSPDGYDPLYPRIYGEFIQSSKNGKIELQFTNQTRSDSVIAPGFGEQNFMNNPYRLRILDLLGVKYVLDRVENGSTEKTFPKERFKLIYEQDGWRIFENQKVLPRAFLATSYQLFKTNEEFETLFFSQDFDPSKTILLEEEPMTGSGPVTGNVEFLSYNPNTVMLKARVDVDGLLFLSDTYYPGWKAFVDGKETKIMKANYAFRAVAVPAGSHEVRFAYQSQSFSLGAKVSIISIVLLILCLKRLKRRKLYS